MENEQKDTPTNKPRLPASLGKEFGRSGTQIMNGIITAEEYNRLLTGKNAIRQYEIMRRSDATAYQALMAMILPLLDAEWSIDAASRDENDEYIARFCEHNLIKDGRINWNDHIREGANMLAFGFSVAEKTYGPGEFEGKFRIVLDKLSFRKQNSIYSWETLEKKPGITQQLLDGQVSIPMAKLVIYTNEKEGDNYEGISRLRRAFKDFDMKDKLGLVYAAGLEKVAIPTPIVKYPSGAPEPEKRAAEQSIAEYRSNEKAFMMVPVGWELDAYTLTADGLKEVKEAIQYFDRQQLRVAMAQFLEIGSKGSSGSFAASDNQNSLYLKALKSVAETMRYTAQQAIVNQLVDLNFSELPNGYPKLVVSKLADDNVAMIAEAVSKFAAANALTMTFDTENALRALIGLEPLPDDYEADFDKRREMSQKMLDNPELDEGDDDGGLKTKPKPGEKKPAVPPKKDKAAAVRAARRANAGLVDVIINSR